MISFRCLRFRAQFLTDWFLFSASTPYSSFSSYSSSQEYDPEVAEPSRPPVDHPLAPRNCKFNTKTERRESPRPSRDHPKTSGYCNINKKDIEVTMNKGCSLQYKNYSWRANSRERIWSCDASHISNLYIFAV